MTSSRTFWFAVFKICGKELLIGESQNVVKEEKCVSRRGRVSSYISEKADGAGGREE